MAASGRHTGGNTTWLLGGWLFADLLLGALIIFMVSMPGFSEAVTPEPMPTLTPTATPAATETPTPEPNPEETPTATPTPRPPCLITIAQEKHVRELPANRGAGGPVPTVEQFRAIAQEFQGQTLGLALVYAYAPNVVRGQDLARDVSQRMQQADGNVFGATAIYEPLAWQDANATNTGRVRLEMFFASKSEGCSSP